MITVLLVSPLDEDPNSLVGKRHLTLSCYPLVHNSQPHLNFPSRTTPTIQPDCSLTMTVLDDLQYETFLNIFSSLSTTDLASASFVCQRWHVISEPILYQEPDIYRKPCSSNSWRKRRGIKLFLRTLLVQGCERLASHVRGICLQWWETTVELTPRRRSNLAAALWSHPQLSFRVTRFSSRAPDALASKPSTSPA